MAVGKPVVCSLNAAFDEMFTDGINARRAPARNPAALAAAMVQLHGEDVDAMGQAGLTKLEQFEWPAIARRYTEVMQAAVEAV